MMSRTAVAKDAGRDWNTENVGRRRVHLTNRRVGINPAFSLRLVVKCAFQHCYGPLIKLKAALLDSFQEPYLGTLHLEHLELEFGIRTLLLRICTNKVVKFLKSVHILL